ncbi:MAG: hypothetical protein GTN49_01850 [candidate division Zixibacteria bacterium]|nr:hypothetical protein [candidate division Zixibacteria bacterium]
MEFEIGATVRVAKINAGLGLKQRLLALGLVPGADIHVVENRYGPVRLCFNNSRIAVGRGVAAKILAAEAPEDVCGECPAEETCPDR